VGAGSSWRRQTTSWRLTGLLRDGARVTTSVPVVLETFTFLERNAAREVAGPLEGRLG
jgi:hypothetical protein